MAKASFKEYRGKKIYYIDYSNLKSEKEFLQAINDTNLFRKLFIENNALKSQLMLVDLSNSYVFGNIFNRLKESGVATKPFIKKQAVVGLTPGKTALLKIYILFVKDVLKSFDTISEALDWLVEV